MAVSPMARVNGSRNQVVGMGVGPLTVTPTEPLVKCFLPLSSTLHLTWPVDFSIEGWNVHSTRGHNNNSIGLEVRTVSQPLWASRASESKARKGALVLAAVPGPDHQGRLLLLHN